MSREQNFQKTLTLYWAIFRSSLLRNSTLDYVLNKILYNGKSFISYWCFGASWSTNNWPWPYTTDLASYLLTKWQFWQLTLKWLSGGRAQDKTKQFYCCFFFQDFIQLCDSRKIHYLTCEFHVKLHGFRVQFNVEFPCQVKNFSIELN